MIIHNLLRKLFHEGLRPIAAEDKGCFGEQAPLTAFVFCCCMALPTQKVHDSYVVDLKYAYKIRTGM